MASTIIYSIYKATNTITGKVYIGYTSKDLAHRIREHKNDSKRCGPNSKFYNSAKEHGWDCFIWETIYQSLDKLYCRDVMENYFINQHDSYHNGYNATMGGEGMDTETVSKRNKKLWNDPNSTFNSVEHKNHLKKWWRIIVEIIPSQTHKETFLKLKILGNFVVRIIWTKQQCVLWPKAKEIIIKNGSVVRPNNFVL